MHINIHLPQIDDTLGPKADAGDEESKNRLALTGGLRINSSIVLDGTHITPAYVSLVEKAMHAHK